jgi:hypothetical protein
MGNIKPADKQAMHYDRLTKVLDLLEKVGELMTDEEHGISLEKSYPEVGKACLDAFNIVDSTVFDLYLRGRENNQPAGGE